MTFNKIVSADDATFQLPAQVRSTIEANIRNNATGEGDAVSDVADARVNALAPAIADSRITVALQNGILFPNIVINGAFDIWQRGTSFTNLASGAYSADRWNISSANAILANVTKDTSVPSSEFTSSMKFAVANAGTPAEWVARQFIERQNITQLSGKTVTLSFWYKSNKTSGKARIGSLNATGGSDVTQTFTVVANTWTKISLTFNTFVGVTGWTGSATDAGGYVDIGFPNSTALTTSDSFQITGVQLEEGSTATPFRRNAPSIQGELAACQRYYWRNAITSSVDAVAFGTQRSVTTQSFAFVNFPTPMRAVPSSLEISAGIIMGDQSTFSIAITSPTIDSATTSNAVILFSHAASGSAYRPIFLIGNNAGDYIAFSAEL